MNRYLVSSRSPEKFPDILEMLNIGGLVLLDKIGPPEKPHTFVVEMSPEQAAVLQQRFSGKLIVEPDQPLTRLD